MPAYDFDAPLERRGTDSLKYDGAALMHRPEGLLPLWVADMDFPTPPEVVDAIVDRARHGVFGYTNPGPGYRASVADWMRKRHGWRIEPDWISVTPGVVFALSAAVRAYSEPGGSVIVQPPVYYPFMQAIRDNGRTVAEAPLRYRGDGRPYEMDFEAFERVAEESGAKLFLLCSPHNPVGRIWRADELERIGGICLKHGICIVSDEIHMDFERPGHRHVPLASLSPELAEATATLTSASKTFNLAGLQTANAVIPNARRRREFQQAVAAAGYFPANTLGLAATQAAYRMGAPWLDALLDYLEGNWALLRERLEREAPALELVEAQGTYLAWVDCRALDLDDAALERFVVDEAGLWLDQGDLFGTGGGGFIRINLATQRAMLDRAIGQLVRAVTRRLAP